jgi:5-methylcytosine-specific restriction endonuclease McrA
MTEEVKRGRPKIQVRTCVCGYTPANITRLKSHIATCSVVHAQSTDTRVQSAEDWEQDRVLFLEQQLRVKDEQLVAERERYNEQLTQLAQKDMHITLLIQTLNRRRADYVGTKRRKIQQSERQQVAARQGWCCADPDGKCLLPDRKLEAEWDVDHLVPLADGGPDTNENLQVLCPACHRRKTSAERGHRPAESDDTIGEAIGVC